jgi:hypothetical protein
MFENGKDNRIEMLPPPAPPLPPASRSKPARPSLFRMARALQAAMAAKGWDARELSDQLRADGIILSQSGIESWMAAEHCPSVIFRDAVAKKLEMDPELLKPEGETDLERVLRERAEKGVETRRRNEALLGRRRSSRLAKFSAAPPEEAPPEEPTPVAGPVEAATVTDEERIERMRDALVYLLQWSDAYPLTVFPEPDEAYWQKAHEVLTANGMTLDRIAASNMRHVITQVGKIAGDALGPKP